LEEKKMLKKIFVILITVAAYANATSVSDGFESGFGYWYYTAGVSLTADNGPSAAGSQAAQLDSRGEYPTSTNLKSLAFSPTGTNPYAGAPFVVSGCGYWQELTFDYKTTVDATGTPQVRLRAYNQPAGVDGKKSGTFLGESVGNLNLTNGNWATTTIYHNASCYAKSLDLVYSLNTYSNMGDAYTGSLKVDNVRVVQAIVPNGKFEVGTVGSSASYWHQSSGVSTVSDNGISAAGNQAVSLAAGTNAIDMRAVAMNISAGEQIKLDFDYKTIGGTEGGLELRVRWCSGLDGANPFAEYATTFAMTGDQWAAIPTIDLTAPQGAQSFDLIFSKYKFDAVKFDGEVRIDNIAVTPVPEPATIALMTIGCLMLKRRKFSL
jgi:hypothetical protein